MKSFVLVIIAIEFLSICSCAPTKEVPTAGPDTDTDIVGTANNGALKASLMEWAEWVKSHSMYKPLVEKGFDFLVELRRVNSADIEEVVKTKDIKPLRNDMRRLDASVVSLESIMNTLNLGFENQKTDVAGLKTDVAGLRTDVARLETRITEDIKKILQLLMANPDRGATGTTMAPLRASNKNIVLRY